MMVVPRADDLSVEAKVNPQDIDKLQIGQKTLRRRMRLGRGVCARRLRSTTPTSVSRWSITETLAWIIWRNLDAVRNQYDELSGKGADWRFEGNASARVKDRKTSRRQRKGRTNRPGILNE